MSELPAETDVLVIGGGPAGAAAALRAAQLGHSVCLIERGDRHWHHGHAQSLPPSALPLLEALGVRDEVEARFPATSGVTLLWAEDRPQRRDFDGAGGLHIERSAFDRIIQDAAARAGAILVRASTVLEVRRDAGSSPGWIVRVAAGGRTSISARAPRRRRRQEPGRRGLRPRGSASRHSLPLLALVGQWRGGRMPTGSLVEAAHDCWYWAGPTGDGSVTAAVFLDPRSRLPGDTTSRRHMRDWSRRRGCSTAYCAAPLGVTACDATSRHVLDPVGASSIHVGEAALSVDPLSSQGIQAALVAALQAAVVLNTWLRRPSGAAAANAFYRERHAEMVQTSRTNSARIYAEAAHRFATPFWSERSGSQSEPLSHSAHRQSDPLPDPSTPVRLALGVQLRRTAVVRHDLAEFAPAIVSTGSGRPVAFVDEVPVGELAGLVAAGTPAAEVVRTWSRRVGEAAALRALSWMWQAGLIAADPDGPRPR